MTRASRSSTRTTTAPGSGEPFIDYNGNGKWDGPVGQLKTARLEGRFAYLEAARRTIPPAGGASTSPT